MPDADAPPPRFTVVVAAREAGGPLTKCLTSLGAVRGIESAQVVAAVWPEPGDAARAALPGAEFVIPDGPRNLAELRGLAFSRARGAWVFLTEPFCDYDPSLLENLDRAADMDAATGSGADVIGGAVRVADDADAAGWASAFFEYGQFFPPLPPEQTGEIPCNNVLYRREILDTIDVWAEKGFWKFFEHERWKGEGRRFAVQPDRAVTHRPPYGFAEFCVRSFHHGRTFGAMRAKGRPAWRRALWTAQAALVPALLTLRLLRRCWPKQSYRWKLIATYPWIAAYYVSWSAGEAAGSALGEGESPRRVY